MFAVLFLALRANWKQFDSERELRNACAVCKNVAKMVNAKGVGVATPGSPCENEESGYCRFVEDLKKEMQEKYNDTVPETACSEIGPCLAETPVNMWGPRCNKCLAVSSLILSEEKEKRKFYMKSFCYSVGSEFTGFCHELSLMGDDAVVPLYENSSDASEFCLTTKFCLPKDGSEEKEMPPEVATLHKSKRSKKAQKKIDARQAKKAKRQAKKAEKKSKVSDSPNQEL